MAKPARFGSGFEIDLRSLAVFRIGLGLVVLADLALRAVDLELFYTDLGILPRAAADAAGYLEGRWSVHLWTGSLMGQGTIFAVHAAVAVSLLLGYRSRTSALFCWVLLVSLHNRNHLILQGGDVLLRCLLLWSILLPLGARWSLDDRHSSVPASTQPLVTPAGAGLLLQVAFVYWFSVLHKTGVDWNRDATAVAHALSLTDLARPLAARVLAIDWLPPLLTRATVWIEILGPLVAFSPLWRTVSRTTAVALMVTLHVGFALCLDIGMFAAISICGWLPFIPGAVWDRLAGRDPVSAGHYRSPMTRWVEGSLGTALLLLISLWNLDPFLSRVTVRSSEPVRRAAAAIRVEQRWSMFAPSVRRETSEWTITGSDTAGQRKPAFVGHRRQRPAKWLRILQSPHNEQYRPVMGAWLCRQDPALKSVTLTRSTRRVRRGGGLGPASEELVWAGACANAR